MQLYAVKESYTVGDQHIEVPTEVLILATTENNAQCTLIQTIQVNERAKDYSKPHITLTLPENEH